MELIKEWVTSIILFVCLAVVIDMLLPASSFKKYTKMVTGLLLIAVILTPLLRLLAADVEHSVSLALAGNSGKGAQLEKKIEEKKREIQEGQGAYILEQMAVQMKEAAEKEMMEEFGLDIVRIDLQPEEAESKELKMPGSVRVSLSASSENGTVAAVRPIVINRETEKEPEILPETNRIISELAIIWEIPEERIAVEVEGGSNNKDGREKGTS